MLALFYGIAFVFADFYRMPYEGMENLLILSLQWLVVVGATFGLLYLLAPERWIFVITFPPLTILCTILVYFRYTVHVSFSATAIELALVNVCVPLWRSSLNSYNNTILYSDYIWTQVINRLRHRRAILFYLSDHAENLGEDGLWGHGEDHEALHYPGCWIWYSDRYEEAFPKLVKNLRNHANRPYNASFLFHSIIASGDILSPYIESLQNLFAP